MSATELIENGYLTELMERAAALNMEVRISPAGGIIMRPASPVSRPASASGPAPAADPVTGNAARCRRYRAAKQPCRTMSPPSTPPMSPGMSDHVAGISKACRDMGGDMVTSPPLPPPPSLSPAPPIPPAPTHTPTPALSAPANARESDAGDGVDVDQVRLLESVLAAYPVNGNATEALRALTGLNATAEDLRAILAKTAFLAAKWRALPARERRFAPRKHTFFEERRWEDDPNEEPWTAAPPEARGSAINSQNQSYGNHRGAAKPPVTRNPEPIPAGSPSLNATAVNARKAEGVVDNERPSADEDGDRDW